MKKTDREIYKRGAELIPFLLGLCSGLFGSVLVLCALVAFASAGAK